MRISRRNFLGGSVGGFFAFAARHGSDSVFAQMPNEHARRCVLLWMNGGPSQLDTFDPKRHSVTGGGVQTIKTSVPGIEITEHLPQIANRMDDLAVLRNITSSEGEHGRATHLLHTGYKLMPSFPRPAMGAVVSHTAPTANFPKYVSIGSQGFGPAFLGAEHAPFSIDEPAAALELLKRVRRRRSRLQLVENLDRQFQSLHPDEAAIRRSALIGQIDRLGTTTFVEALALEREPASAATRYGDHKFGRDCLLARRMLDAGVSFVEVHSDGWDTHANNGREVKQLCRQIDRPWSALLDDLRSANMLKDTLVVWMGEFGRTPRLNAQAGRDHFPSVVPVVLAGCGLDGGRVIGSTNKSGSEISSNSHSIADLFATIFERLAIDTATEFTTDFGAPSELTDGGTPIAELC